MLKTAWAEDPKLAIQVAIRSQSPALMNEIRWHLLNYPQKAIGDPEALHILLQDGLTSDISFQLKVALSMILFLNLLTMTVPLILGPCQPHHGCHLFSPKLQKQSFHYSVRNASLRKPLG